MYYKPLKINTRTIRKSEAAMTMISFFDELRDAAETYANEPNEENTKKLAKKAHCYVAWCAALSRIDMREKRFGS